MRRPLVMLAALALPPALPAQTDSATGPDPIAQLVARLDLERYKATIKGLTNFGCAVGGGRYRGVRARTGVNTDSTQQPDARPRAQAPLHSLFASGIEEVSRSLRGRRPRGDTDTAVLTALARINAPC